MSKGGLGSHALTVAIVGYLAHAGPRVSQADLSSRTGYEARPKLASKGFDGSEGGEEWGQEHKDDDDEEEEDEEEEEDLGALLIGFMTTVGSLDVTRRFISATGVLGPKPVAWMTASEFVELKRKPPPRAPVAPGEGSRPGLASVAEPPRLGVEDPLYMGRNLAAGSHKIAGVLAALAAAGESLARAGPTHARLDAVLDVSAVLAGRPAAHGRGTGTGGTAEEGARGDECADEGGSGEGGGGNGGGKAGDAAGGGGCGDGDGAKRSLRGGSQDAQVGDASSSGGGDGAKRLRLPPPDL